MLAPLARIVHDREGAENADCHCRQNSRYDMGLLPERTDVLIACLEDQDARHNLAWWEPAAKPY
jgi:hypothetical protein